MKKLILTIGLPQSGKSTWAKSTSYPIVNRDSIRLAIGGSIRYFEEENRVSEIEKIMVKSLFAAGHDTVIVDATHLKEKYRKAWESDDWKIEFKRFKTPLKECLKRARKGHPNDTKFPAVIESMWENAQIDFEIPDKYTELDDSGKIS